MTATASQHTAAVQVARNMAVIYSTTPAAVAAALTATTPGFMANELLLALRQVAAGTANVQDLVAGVTAELLA